MKNKGKIKKKKTPCGVGIEGVRSISIRPRGGEEVISLGHLVAVCFILRVVRTYAKVRCNFML